MITIIGAGKVGGDAALFSALRKLDDEILLLDIAEGLPQGEAMDLNHMLSEQGIDVNVKGSNNYEDMRGSKIVVVVAGAGRKPGMTRMDLLKINAGVVKDVVGNIKKFADDAMIIPVSTNLDGEYEQKDVSIGVPAVIGKNGVEKIIELELNDEEQQWFNKGIDSVKNALSGVEF